MERLIGFLPEDALVLDMTAASKDEAIRELIDVVVKRGDADESQRDAIVEAVLQRESIGSTGLGDGIAIPHVKDTPLIDGLTGAFGRHKSGVDFGAVDGNPVDLIFLILGGEGTAGEHVKILRSLASLRQNPHFLRFLRDASDEEAVLDVIRDITASFA